MIRRLLILVGAVTVIFAGVTFLSHDWQFGYVGSWQSIGLRDEKLWYVWRTAPISDGEGFYVDDASDFNRAMYSINAGARWRDKPVWPWLLGVLAIVGYSLILPPIRRLWKHPAPRRLIGALTATCVLLAVLWTTSHVVTITYYGSNVHFRLADGTVSVNIDQQQIMQTGWWGKGWSVQRGPVSFINYGGYFSWRSGLIMANLPLGALLIVLLVPTIVLARPDRRAWIGHCKRCAYDLTGNISGVCPEYGTKCENAETPKYLIDGIPTKVDTENVL